jgi:hypothetical protein
MPSPSSSPSLRNIAWEEPLSDGAPPSRTISSSGLPTSESCYDQNNNQQQYYQPDEREVGSRRQACFHRSSRRFRSHWSGRGLSLGNQQSSIGRRSWRGCRHCATCSPADRVAPFGSFTFALVFCHRHDFLRCLALLQALWGVAVISKTYCLNQALHR